MLIAIQASVISTAVSVGVIMGAAAAAESSVVPCSVGISCARGAVTESEGVSR